MSSKFKATLLMLVGFALILAACAAPAPQATNTSAPAPTEAAAQATEPPAPASTDAPTAAATSSVSFATDVMPILQNRCFNCHGGDSTKEGLSFASYETLMTGSNNGPVIVAGDAANSLLVQMLQKGKMPKRGPKLTPEQVQIIIDWINAGALNN
jgi:uncharacterized membrane protein